MQWITPRLLAGSLDTNVGERVRLGETDGGRTASGLDAFLAVRERGFRGVFRGVSSSSCTIASDSSSLSPLDRVYLADGLQA